MPTYQYECAKCGQHFDLFQSMKDAALEVCPRDKCGRTPWGKGKVTRLLGTGAGLIFKGSGFYITDYRSEGYKTAAKKEKESASGGDSARKSESSGSSASASSSSKNGASTSGASSVAKPSAT
jgi:putative FmdB family regulatory protein